MDLETIDDGIYEMQHRPNWRGLDIELSPQEELACAFRIVAQAGCNLDVAGHITAVADGAGNMWCNPWGIWWEEICASDIIMVDKDGNHLAGRWPPNPAIFIHTEVHQRRGRAGRVALHNHPHYGILLGTMGIVPEVTDQQSCVVANEVGLYNEYGGGVATLDEGVGFADGVGDHATALLKNHGCLITAPSVRLAAYKAVMFERMCRLNYEALAVGVKPSPVPEDQQSAMKPLMSRYACNFFWEGAVRQLLAREPDVLT
jgi:ribulose-5-phosphate 4-epimerase/fuculose-1-phosphate aldolase